MLLHYKLLTNHSGSNGFDWEGFDFDTCDSHKEGIYVWAVSSIICFVFGFPASIAILWELLKAHRRGIPLKPNDFFMLNLSAMDTVFFVFMVPGVCNHLIWHIWVFEAIWNAFFALNICGRPLMMACICLDCYLAVVHPIIYHKKKSLTPRVVMAGIVWTLTVATGIAYSLSRDLYFTMFPSVPFMIAIAIIVVCDSFILHTLIRSDPGRKNIHAQKQRAIQTLINSLVIAAISYVPPVIMSIFGKHLFANFTIYMCFVAVPITITSTLGSAVMPLLYLNNLGKLDRFKLCKS
ncbi:hypothetical protein F2P81_022288 [Scomber scombrus]|uniref:G-protein coupled receptors family 1 profile domain-containing protein n=1 Tax=Scomber scombrus TaxID=13677 RepID=A0AAV1PK52_SCOSC